MVNLSINTNLFLSLELVEIVELMLCISINLSSHFSWNICTSHRASLVCFIPLCGSWVIVRDWFIQYALSGSGYSSLVQKKAAFGMKFIWINLFKNNTISFLLLWCILCEIKIDWYNKGAIENIYLLSNTKKFFLTWWIQLDFCLVSSLD